MQEINLYVPELQPRELSFSANFCLYASVILIVVLCGIQFIASSSLANLQRNVETLENQRAASSERVAQIKTSSIYASSVLLDQHILELRSQIRDRQNVGKIIEWQNLGNEEGFAHVLESLARHSSHEFSLQRIRLSAGGNHLEFSGETRRAEAIPLYLQALQTDTNMAQTRFGLLSMGGEQDIKQFSLGFDTVYKLAGDKK